jgi:hypothetical protein
MSGQSKTRSPLARRTIRAAMLVALCAGLAACVGYLARRSSCETDEHALRGEVKRLASGKLLYFDGRCWSAKPMPPTDAPF